MNNNGSATKRLRIMIVEDEPDIGLILSEILGPDYEVVRAANGLEALERLNWYEPDITIMDLMMPVLDGFDTTRAIKKDNEYANMPVLFLTARKDNQAVREALMAGGDVYLEKPFDPPELLTRLNEMIERSNVLPRPKRHTMQQILVHFSTESDKTIHTEAPLPPAGAPLTAQLARAAAEPKARVMVVAEAEDTVKNLKQLMKSRHEVIATQDPESALDKIAAYQPDVLVLETQMPRFNGFHLAHLTKINRQLRVPYILFMAASDDENARKEARRLNGLFAVVGDPVDSAIVAEKVNDVTRSADFRRQRKRLDFREILRREEPADDEL